MSVGPVGRPQGVGYRPVTQIFQTAGSYQWAAPADIQPWTGVYIEVVGGGANGGAGGVGTTAASGGTGGSAGGLTYGTRRGFCPGQKIPLVVGALTASSSATIPTGQGGNMTSTGGTTGTAGSSFTGGGGANDAGPSGPTGGTGSGSPTDYTETGQSGQDGGGGGFQVGCFSIANSGAGGKGGDTPNGRGRGGPGGSSSPGGPTVIAGKPGRAATGRGSGGGGGGGSKEGATAGGTGGGGQTGIIIITVWTQDPGYLDLVT